MSQNVKKKKCKKNQIGNPVIIQRPNSKVIVDSGTAEFGRDASVTTLSVGTAVLMALDEAVDFQLRSHFSKNFKVVYIIYSQ